MTKLLIFIAALFLISCTSQPQRANLTFVGIERNGDNVEIQFSSDVNLITLFSENRTQRQVLSELICSLNDDDNFNFDHQLAVFANGRLTASHEAKQNQYNFSAALMFWRAPANQSGSDVMLTDEETVHLIENQKSIPCLYRMTVYLAQPYYSHKMQVPSGELIRIMRSTTLKTRPN